MEFEAEIRGTQREYSSKPLEHSIAMFLRFSFIGNNKVLCAGFFCHVGRIPFRSRT